MGPTYYVVLMFKCQPLWASRTNSVSNSSTFVAMGKPRVDNHGGKGLIVGNWSWLIWNFKGLLTATIQFGWMNWIENNSPSFNSKISRGSFHAAAKPPIMRSSHQQLPFLEDWFWNYHCLFRYLNPSSYYPLNPVPIGLSAAVKVSGLACRLEHILTALVIDMRIGLKSHCRADFFRVDPRLK